MADIGTKEASEKWGVSQAVVRKWCKDGLIKVATQDRKYSPWHIPKNAKKPNIKGGKISNNK